MRDKMERLVLLPFVAGCMSESSVAVASPTQNEPRSKDDHGQLAMMGREMQKQGDRESEDCSLNERTKNSFGFIPLPKPNISAGIHRLSKGLKSFSQLFVYKEDVEEEKAQIEIGREGRDTHLMGRRRHHERHLRKTLVSPSPGKP